MAKGQFLVASLILLISISLVGLLGVGSISADPQGNGPSRVISVLGITQVQGQDVFVDILVQVQPGQNANDVARDALQSQGARPFDSANLGSEGFTLIGSVWNSFPVLQNYNPDNEPSSLNGNGLTALTSSQATWTGVTTSLFAITFDELTTSCPSLISKCPGPRFFDGENDVGWLKLRRNVLGVASFTGQEADMALSTSFNWNDGCTVVANSRDVETVFLHELGHVVGLRHSNDGGSVMLPNYHGPDCDLGTDDEQGATFLYDTAITGSVSGTVTDGTDPIVGATVVLEGTSFSATTVAGGTYTISSVPDPVIYTVTASAGDASSTLDRLPVNGSIMNIDFTLDIGDGGNGGGNGGGKCPPQSKSKKCP